MDSHHSDATSEDDGPPPAARPTRPLSHCQHRARRRTAQELDPASVSTFGGQSATTAVPSPAEEMRTTSGAVTVAVAVSEISETAAPRRRRRRRGAPTALCSAAMIWTALSHAGVASALLASPLPRAAPPMFPGPRLPGRRSDGPRRGWAALRRGGFALRVGPGIRAASASPASIDQQAVTGDRSGGVEASAGGKRGGGSLKAVEGAGDGEFAQKAGKGNNSHNNNRNSNNSNSINSNKNNISSNINGDNPSPHSPSLKKSQTSRQQQHERRKPRRQKYSRKRPLPPSERAASLSRRRRQSAYDALRTKALEVGGVPPSIWTFDGLFAAPVWDEDSVREDLFGVAERERETVRRRDVRPSAPPSPGGLKSMLPKPANITKIADAAFDAALSMGVPLPPRPSPAPTASSPAATAARGDGSASSVPESDDAPPPPPGAVDKALTRMVEDRITGVQRTPSGEMRFSASLLPADSAVRFREGVRLGKPLAINADRLCHFAKKDIRRGRLEEAQESYEEAQRMDPTDGRPYLGLSRIAQRRGDIQQARGWLRAGISRSTGGYVTVRAGPSKSDIATKNKKNRKGGRETKRSFGGSKLESSGDWDDDDDEDDGLGDTVGEIPDAGPNPFLLQALGTLEEKAGNLALAEELYLAALRSRPSHAAAWVGLAQLRTRKLRQGAPAGRACYLSAEREWKRVGAKPNAHVYTAWASLEYKKAKDHRRARELFGYALDADPRCSAALLQLGMMESERGNFDAAEECFERALKFDKRNSRILQAYAIMESRRWPEGEEDSRGVLDLFERALKVNPRDAGVYQAYGLYVVQLGDVDSGRDLLRKGTGVDKRHAPVWQAWGVLETRYGTAKAARDVFQRGIWACAQGGGGQSGGRRCARLWQAWGVLEAREGDHTAARRCFSRALDADNRNVAAVTAWTKMEEELGNYADARSIFERTLKQFPSPSDDKMTVWRAYEITEERAGSSRAAQLVFQRSMREAIASREAEENLNMKGKALLAATVPPPLEQQHQGSVVPGAPPSSSSSKRKNSEVEVSRWTTSGMDADVWINNGSIEGKVPAEFLKKMRTQKR